jgi:predicted  nucleic acid-binding Zn-ribbon protein
MTTLSNEDKISIINQHKRNVEFNKYNLEISIVEESAVAVPNTDAISSLNSQIQDLDNKIAALDAEIAALQ